MAEGWSYKTPLSKGVQVVLFVVRESPDNFSDLMQASESTLEFWDNPIDEGGWDSLIWSMPRPGVWKTSKTRTFTPSRVLSDTP
ncbi:MAG: hypothetical protein U9N46_02450 [Euryarchaeota archaeon]|nr:hypothetical protein [Euryarchaeota archaeon]